MNTIETLRATRKLLEKPESWTKGFYAVDSKGYEVSAKGVFACQWCLMGATRKMASNSVEATEATPALHSVLPFGKYGTVPNFNDAPETKHEDVLALIDRAIAKLEAT